MTMRITGGRMRGRKLSTKTLGVCSRHGVLRATSSKVREALFDIIGADIAGSVFVDLFAGTGAVGMDAMSRGAETVYFVEADRNRADEIRNTLDGCGCQGRSQVVPAQALRFLEKAEDGGERFDIVFLDPPYGSEDLLPSLELLGNVPCLEDEAMVIAEHEARLTLPEAFGNLKMRKVYRYGDTSLSMYRKKP